jgi:uncharacterized protein (TIGR02996 family)
MAEVWTQRAHGLHWRWYGPLLLQEVATRKDRLGLAFEGGFELSLGEAATEAERREIRSVYADWLEEHGHPFESVCCRVGRDPADVLVREEAAWGIRRGQFVSHPDFHADRLRFPLLGPQDSPTPGQCYPGPSEARADFLHAWRAVATAGDSGDGTPEIGQDGP